MHRIKQITQQRKLMPGSGLALPFSHKSRHSESPGGYMQGARPAAMVVPLQESATQQIAAGRLARREPLHTGHPCVAALANGTAIICAPRLGLACVQGFCDVICG